MKGINHCVSDILSCLSKDRQAPMGELIVPSKGSLKILHLTLIVLSTV